MLVIIAMLKVIISLNMCITLARLVYHYGHGHRQRFLQCVLKCSIDDVVSVWISSTWRHLGKPGYWRHKQCFPR